MGGHACVWLVHKSDRKISFRYALTKHGIKQIDILWKIWSNIVFGYAANSSISWHNANSNTRCDRSSADIKHRLTKKQVQVLFYHSHGCLFFKSYI